MTQRATAVSPGPVRSAADGWVLDVSVTLPWFFADEAMPFTEGLPDQLAAQPIWAPALWVLECANVLQSAQRRLRIDAGRRAEIVDQLGALPVRIDHEPLAFATIDRLAATHGLSAYGAAYLELALRRSLTLVSLDARLLAAARQLGHPVLTTAIVSAT